MSPAAITHKHTAINPAYATPRSDDVDGANWLEPHVLQAPEIGSVIVGDPSSPTGAEWVSPGGAGKVLMSNGPGQLPTFEPAIAVGNHKMLSSTHEDATIEDAIRGSFMVAEGEPAQWTQMEIGPDGAMLVSNGLDPVWVTSLPGLTLTGLTEGRVVVVGPGGALADDSGLTWDGVSLILGDDKKLGSTGLNFLQFDPTYDGAPVSGVLVGNGTEAESFVLQTGPVVGINAENSSSGFNIIHGGRSMRVVDDAVVFNGQSLTLVATDTPIGIGDGVELAAVDLEGAGTRGFYFIDELLRVHTLGRLLQLAVADTTKARVGGVLSSQAGSVGNPASTVETDAFTLALPANALAVNGQRLRVEMWGTKPLTASTVMRLRLGASELVALTTGGTAEWKIAADVVRTGAATQDVVGEAARDVYVAPTFTQPTENLAGALTVKGTVASVAGGAANQVLAKGFRVMWFPE